VVERRAINLVNAQHVAAERGIETASTTVDGPRELGEEIELRLEGGERSIRVGGALLGETHGRIVRIGPFRVDVAPRGVMLVLRNRDVPGVIGRVGTLLGEAAVNIAEYHQARLQVGGEALAAVSVDDRIPHDVDRAPRRLPRDPGGGAGGDGVNDGTPVLSYFRTRPRLASCLRRAANTDTTTRPHGNPALAAEAAAGGGRGRRGRAAGRVDLHRPLRAG
jgi:hypothetical protein